MSNMELRSSRSRSKTPFLTQDFISNEVLDGANHVEKTVTRSTRRTTVYKTSEGATSSSEHSAYSKPIKKSATRSERSLRSRLFKTSDYSSEDGENEVSSTKTISQNEKNQLIEDALSATNNGDMPALELYKKSGRYWEVYPKTDWTYSYHSKDRVEIAPGVVAMPNMSRKTIHALDESSSELYSGHVSHKTVNTEDSYLARHATNLRKNLFNNNQQDYEIKRQRYSRWSIIKNTTIAIFTSVITILTSVVEVFNYIYRVQTNLLSKVHNLASRVMLFDTWLLWKTRPGNKATKLALLCLIPLLLFGGWWLLSGVGSVLHATFSNYTLPALFTTNPFASKSDGNLIADTLHTEPLDLLTNSDGDDNKLEEHVVRVRESYVGPPTASEIASGLSDDQLELIARTIQNSFKSDANVQINVDDLVHRIVENHNFHTIINNFYDDEVKSANGRTENLLEKYRALIATLTEEIDNMKRNMVRAETLRRRDHTKLTFEIKRCCQRPVIDTESYVTRVVADLLNNPDFLQNQKGLNDWLESLFVAKQVLEERLANITVNVDSKTADLVQENSKILMNKVAATISDVKIRNVNFGQSGAQIDENEIKKIVRDALVIYDADKTGLVDYAMETMGGQIVTTRCTENYNNGKAVVSVLGIPLWYPVNSPRTVITPSINPGDCWAFQNFPGFVVIKLSDTVELKAFSLEHISKLLVPDGRIDSAPRDFEVYGLRRENDKEPVKLGSYTYDYDGDSLQFFPVEGEDRVFGMIELRVISNHGNPNYTCLYRFRVHGKPYHDQQAR